MFFMTVLTMIEFADLHQGFCMVLLTAALATSAIVSCILAYKNIKALKESELERARPIVVFEIIPDIPFYIVRMRNAGLTAARNITVTISPNLEYCFKSWDGKAIGFLSRKIEFLAPNALLQTSIGTFHDIERHNATLLYSGMVRYMDANGKTYEDIIALDFSLFADMIYSGAKTINNIGIELEKIRQAIDGFGHGSSKLQIIAQSLNDYRQEQIQLSKQVKSKLENLAITDNGVK